MAVERLQATDAGKPIDIPSGMVHHWVGAVFVPGVPVGRAVAMLQAYDRHFEVYRPAVVRSSVIERDGDRWRIFLQMFMKKVIAVTVNTESVAQFVSHAADRVSSSMSEHAHRRGRGSRGSQRAGEARGPGRRLSLASEPVLAFPRARRRDL